MKSQTDKILLIIIAGFISGIFCIEFFQNFFINNILFFIFIGLIGFAVLYFFIILKKDKFKKNYKMFFGFLASVFLIFFAFSSVRYIYEFSKTDELYNFVGKEVKITGVVSSEITESKYYKNFQIKVFKVNDKDIKTELEVLVRQSGNEKVFYKDKIILTGLLEKPENFLNETGIEFDYRGYLRARGVGYIFSKSKIISIEKNEKNFMTFLFSVKESFIEKIESVYNFPESALLSGLLVGSKQSLGEENLEKFRRAGVTHIIVLSGFNIAIVASIILAVTGIFSRYFSFLLATIGVVSFSLMVGLEATVVRATIMVLIALSGKLIGRNYNALRALFIAGLIMVFINPFLLFNDVSFQLSFVATLGLILVTPVIEKYFVFIPEVFGLREVIVSTLAVEILVIPLILYKMGSVSVVSLLSNVLILPVIAPTMLFGFLSGLFGFMSQTLAMIIGYPAYLLLRYELLVIDFVSQFEFSLINIGRVSWIVLLMIYFSITMFLIYLKRLNSREK